MISIRVNKELEHSLEIMASNAGVSKSAIIRQCLEKFVADKKSEETAWELGKNLFGKYGSGKKNLSTDRKKIVAQKIHAAKSHN